MSENTILSWVSDMNEYPRIVVFNDGRHTTLLKPEDLIEFICTYMGTDSAELFEDLIEDHEILETARDIISGCDITDEIPHMLTDILF